ncbi:MAG: Uma2 family endonuclease [Rhodopirellula sp. JB053]
MSEVLHESGVEYGACVPQLNSGDRLDHDEYLRRYSAASENLKAERINGKVYLMNSLRAAWHGNPHALLAGWLFVYAMKSPELVTSDNSTVLLNSDNDPQPDLCMYRVGGQTQVNDEGYLVGPPELIVEIAGSSASYDFGEKRDVYEAAGVGEYLVFETIEGRIEWWRQSDGKFVDVPVVDGVRKSVLFPGLWLDEQALRRGDSQQLVDTLQRGMDSV